MQWLIYDLTNGIHGENVYIVWNNKNIKKRRLQWTHTANATFNVKRYKSIRVPINNRHEKLFFLLHKSRMKNIYLNSVWKAKCVKKKKKKTTKNIFISRLFFFFPLLSLSIGQITYFSIYSFLLFLSLLASLRWLIAAPVLTWMIWEVFFFPEISTQNIFLSFYKF